MEIGLYERKMNLDVMVSIVIPIYNHEKYLQKAINSVLMQKVNFKYEVLIAEDCSKDNSRQILERMSKDFPDYVHVYYRETNYGAEKNFEDLYERMQGKYYIVLEADDYWIYEYKLQKQVEFLEQHKDYLAVAHNTIVVDENSDEIPIRYPECMHEEYSIIDYTKGVLPGQTATILFRNYFKESLFNYNITPVPYPGDRRRAFFIVANGKVKCIQSKWSAYRSIKAYGTSFSATCKRNPVSELLFDKSLYDYSIDNELSADIVLEIEKMYFWKVFLSIFRKDKRFDITYFGKAFAKAHFKRNVVSFLARKILTYPFSKIRYIKNEKYEEKVYAIKKVQQCSK